MKLFIIAKSNIKKKKSSLIILFLLITIATTLLYIGINVIKNIDDFIKDTNEAQNGPHVQFLTTVGYRDKVVDLLKKEEGFDTVETDEVLTSTGTKELFNIDKDKETESMRFIFADYENNHSIPKIKVIGKAMEYKKNSIIVPMYMKIAKGYETGDIIEIKSGKNKYSYEIYGFVEDVLYSTISNIDIYRCYISHDEFIDIQKNDPGYITVDQYNIRVNDINKSDKFHEIASKHIEKEINDGFFSCILGVNYSIMSAGLGMYINIIMAILAIFSIIIIAIAVIVICFSIITNIESNMTNVGILEAVGYTAKQLAFSLIIEYMLISIAAVLVGLGVALISSSAVASIVSSSIGLLWRIDFDIIVAVESITLVLLVIFIVTYGTTRRYLKIAPLDALREGVKTHNFKKNYFPLSTTKLGLNTAIGMKSMFHNRKQNISIIFIVALLSFTCTISLALYYNFVFDQQELINLFGTEKPDIEMSINNESENKLKNDKEIDKIIHNDSKSINIKKGDKEIGVLAEIYDNVDELTVDKLIEGRLPNHSNEINLSNKVLEDIGAEVGDTVTVTIEGKDSAFVVVGKTQQIEHMGLGALITEEGVGEIINGYRCNKLYIYLKKDINIEAKVQSYSVIFEDNPEVEITNFDKIYQITMRTFVNAIESICILFVVVTIFVIALIIYLIVKIKIIHQRREIGLYKAVGYTTSEVMWQIVVNFALIMSVGALIGGIIGKLSMGKITAISLSICGIENASIIVPISLVIGVFIVITLAAFLLTIISAIGIRKIEPYKMITEI